LNTQHLLGTILIFSAVLLWLLPSLPAASLVKLAGYPEYVYLQAYDKATSNYISADIKVNGVIYTVPGDPASPLKLQGLTYPATLEALPKPGYQILGWFFIEELRQNPIVIPEPGPYVATALYYKTTDSSQTTTTTTTLIGGTQTTLTSTVTYVTTSTYTSTETYYSTRITTQTLVTRIEELQPQPSLNQLKILGLALGVAGVILFISGGRGIES